jgi:hypothetical protein
LALAALLLTGTAAAQVGRPTPLAPPDAQPPDSPQRSAPAVEPPPQSYAPPPGYPPPSYAPPGFYPPPPGAYPAPPGTPPPAIAGPKPSSSGITVDTLAPPSPDAAGVLGPNEHGFPATLWQDTTRATVMALLPKIGTTTSPALQDLAYRLLATSAPPPTGPGEGSLLALRAERLTDALGRADSALALLQSLPADQRSEDLAKVTVDLAFLSGERSSACREIRSRDRSWRSPSWDQGLVVCAVLDGDATEAQLGLDLLREAKFKDEGFSALVQRALGTEAKLPDALPSPQPMALTLLDKAGAAVPKKALDGARLPVLVAIANGSGFPPEQRVVAAEKAASLGALAPEALAAAYLNAPFDEGDTESPVTRAAAAGGARGRAMLFHAAHDATEFQAKANFLQTLLLKSPRTDVYPAVVRAALPVLQQVPVSIELKPLAVDFARAFYAADRPEEARQWLDLADPPAAASVLALAHVAAGAAAPPWSDTPLTDLAGGGGKKDTALAQRRATVLAQLLTAEGVQVPATLLVALLDTPAGGASSVGPGLLIDGEADAKHLGGTLLAVLAALGDIGAGAPSQTVAQAIAGLRKVGLDDEARHLAIDAALAAGL